MNCVPGVITFESIEASAAAPPFSRRASAASFADLKRRERCWFIFARGAGPSTAR